MNPESCQFQNGCARADGDSRADGTLNVDVAKSGGQLVTAFVLWVNTTTSGLEWQETESVARCCKSVTEGLTPRSGSKVGQVVVSSIIGPVSPIRWGGCYRVTVIAVR